MMHRREQLAHDLMHHVILTLGAMDDEILRTLSVTNVVLRRGKEHADVFLLDENFSKTKRDEILKRLKRAQNFIKTQIFASSGWFKCPNLNFVFDDWHEKSHKIDEIFSQIQSERK